MREEDLMIVLLAALFISIAGVIYFYKKWARFGGAPDAEFSGHILAIQEMLDKSNRLYLLVRQLHQAIMKATDEGMLFDEACRISVAAGKFRRACIGTRSEETGQIVVVASAGEDADFIPGMAAVPDWSSGEKQMVPAERVVREGRSVVCNDIRNSPTPSVWREAVLKKGFGSSIAIPIKRFGRVFGVFELYGDQHFFDAEEVSVLEDIAAGLAFVVELLERDAMRNKMEEELLKSKQSYQILSDTSPVGIFHTDAKGSTTYVNRRWCEISGMSSEDALGDGWFAAVHPEDRESLFSGWRIAVSVGSSSGSQYRMIRPDGSIVWVLGQAVPEKGFDGRIVGYIGTATDITGLKAAEEAASRSAAEQRKAQEVLARKEKWFRALIENSTDGITVLDGDGAVIDITPSGEKILGYSRDELVGRVRADLVHPADIGTLQEAFRAIKANPNDVRTVAHRHLRRDGSYRWLECSYKNLLNEPYLNAIVLNYRDITEKKQADLQLRRSEERYRKAQSIGRMGHWELDIENDILTWSDEIYRIFDVDKSDFGNCYEAFRKCVHPDDVQQLVQSREHTLRGQGKFDFVYRIVCRHGKIKYVHELADTVFSKDGKPRSVTGTVQDITEQIVSKNEIINERNLSDCIINSLPAVFCMFTREGEMIRWNVNLETVTSYSREEIGKMRPYDLFDMEERALVAEMADGVFRNGENQVQANLLTRNGEKIPYFLTGRAIHYEGRHCLLGVGIDFSDRIRAQRKIKETSRQLRQLAAHLQHIREEERTGIARDIHDDLGQQLTAVQISLYRVAKRATGNEPLQRDIEMVNAMTSGAIESIRKIAMQLRPGILEDMGLLEAMKWQIEEFENRFSIPVAADFSGVPDGVSPEVSINLFRIFQETLTNIARHACAGRVEVLFRAEGRRLRLIVRDDGRGIDPEEIRARRTLGLLGMKERAYSIGGHLEVRSQPGQGTTIKVAVVLKK